MVGMGTIINVAAILFGGILGKVFGKLIKERVQETLMMALGISVLFLGIGGALEKMLAVENGQLVSGKSMMIIGSFVLGAIVGEWLDLDGKMERFGAWLKVKTKSEGDNDFIEAFVSTSLTVCIGAMAVVGSIEDGISGDYSLLVAKAVLDFTLVMIMTASLGKGCVFSAIPVGIFQGSITILARFIEPIMTEQALSNLSLTGSMLIFCVGLNLIWGKKIRVANLLPTIVFAVAWAFLPA